MGGCAMPKLLPSLSYPTSCGVNVGLVPLIVPETTTLNLNRDRPSLAILLLVKVLTTGLGITPRSDGDGPNCLMSAIIHPPHIRPVSCSRWSRVLQGRAPPTRR